MNSAIDLNALISSVSFLESAGYVGLFDVLVGVIGETVHEFSPWPKWEWWHAKGGKISALILIAGLAVEGVAQVNANNNNAQIIAFLEDETANVNLARATLESKLVDCL